MSIFLKIFKRSFQFDFFRRRLEPLMEEEGSDASSTSSAEAASEITPSPTDQVILRSMRHKVFSIILQTLDV